jgi:hypothetical protein
VSRRDQLDQVEAEVDPEKRHKLKLNQGLKLISGTKLDEEDLIENLKKVSKRSSS